MTPTEFCYWLQGYFELSESEGDMSSDQIKIVKNHLALVFYHHIDEKDPKGISQTIHDVGQLIPKIKYRC